MNEPYVKKYDAKRVLKNPISESYVSSEPNRAQRRRKEPRFINNRDTCHIKVIGTRKFKLVLSRQIREDGSIAINKHYLEN